MRILALTSIRSDYDLMSPLYRKLATDPSFDFGIIVGGTHNSDFHKDSARNIVKDGLHIVAKVFNFVGHDDYISQISSGAKLLESIGVAIEQFQPDLILVVGDREDALMLSIAATYMRIPLVHFYGGDHASDGHVDNQVRHAISKLATVHFVTMDVHRDRLISIGEEPHRIRVVGSIALDNFFSEPSIGRSDLFHELFPKSLNESDSIGFLLYHPIVEEMEEFENSFEALLNSIIGRGMHLIIGKSNNDPKFLHLEVFMSKYRNHPGVHFIESLGRTEYINLMRNIEIMLGNSSAGLLEMASLKVPVVNIGARQRGRHADRNVIFSDLSSVGIEKSIESALSQEFNNDLRNLKNSYGDGNSVEKVMTELKSFDYKNLIKKRVDPLNSKGPE
jgi:UDP-hydrolysing UDP-N-acetyl-D-glucosamine 2-epimerase